MTSIERPGFVQQCALLLDGAIERVDSEDGLEIIANNRDRIKSFWQRVAVEPGVVALSGTSESGKSHWGKRWLAEGLASRLKIYKLVRVLGEEGQVGAVRGTDGRVDPIEMATKMANSEDAAVVGRELRSRLLEGERGYPVAVVETFKHQGLIDAIRGAGVAVLSVFVDADLEMKAKREAEKTGGEVDEIRVRTVQKDKEKEALGNREVREQADLIIVNNGSLESYNRFLDLMAGRIRQVKPATNGRPFEYGGYN